MTSVVTTATERAYRSLWRAAWPLVRWYVRRKDRLRFVDACATAERFGESVRPAEWGSVTGGRDWTLWLHGASVGECLSALSLVELVLSPRFPLNVGSDGHNGRQTRVVLTTSTAAARQLLRARLASDQSLSRIDASRVACVFAPLDSPKCVQQFYDTWQPDAGIWIESELWPTLILEAARRKIQVGLVNARISPRSVGWWTFPLAHQFIQHVVGQFSLVLCQDQLNHQRYAQLGARNAQVVTNLKFASQRLRGDATVVAALRQRFSTRRVWLATSTHENEELMMASVHMAIAERVAKSDSPRLLTVIIPRHPERGATVQQQIQAKFTSLDVARRSEHAYPTTSTDIYIADSMGETAIFYDAIPIVVMGGTFVPRGGHNPIEPLRAGCRVVYGPHMFNFADVVAQLRKHDDFRSLLSEVASIEQLGTLVEQFLVVQDKLQRRDDAAAVMQNLSVTTLNAYESQIVSWLIRDPTM